MGDTMKDVRREIDRLRATSSAAVIPALVALENALADHGGRIAALEARVAAEVPAAAAHPIEQAAPVAVTSQADAAAKSPVKPTRSARAS